MSKKQVFILLTWLIILSGQYYFSKTVTRFFPEFVLPSFPYGAFNMDTMYLKTYMVEIDYGQGEIKAFNYQEFLTGLPESTRINSFANIFEKSKANLGEKEIQDWYRLKAARLNPGKKAQVLRVQKINYQVLSKDFKCKKTVVSKDILFAVNFE